jgi:hypothetical protein
MAVWNPKFSFSQIVLSTGASSLTCSLSPAKVIDSKEDQRDFESWASNNKSMGYYQRDGKGERGGDW